MYIAGQWIGSGSAGGRPVYNPADGQVLAHLPMAGEGELQLALEAAQQGFEVWSQKPAYERFKVLRKAADLIRVRAAHSARVMTLEQGKPVAEATREFVLTADIIDFLAEEGKRAYGRTVPPRSSAILLQQVQKVPVGPVLALTPWNFPANLPGRKIGGALAAGCSCIIKPAETTPASCQLLIEAFAEAGLPDGVLNLVYGDPAYISSLLIASPVIKKVSFTGSPQVGKHLAALAAAGAKRVTLELGGHAPVIIAGDADVSRAAAACVIGKFRNAGQVCTSPSRFFVQKSVFHSFLEHFVKRTTALKVGSGLEGADMGPLAHAGRVAAMNRSVEATVRAGARLEFGGARRNGAGYFYEPTVLSGAPAESIAMTEEPFGPIASIVAFDDLDEAVRLANSLPYALAAYAFTSNLDRAHALGHRLRAGMVGINHFAVSQPETPFGGLDESGYGSESGTEGMLSYMDTKFVSFGTANL